MRTPDAKLFSVPPTRSRVHDNLRNIQIVAPAASPDRGLLLNYFYNIKIFSIIILIILHRSSQTCTFVDQCY